MQNYYYSPFGELWQGERESDTNPFRYAGEYLDKETGNIYLRARYYDPSIGRFISEDPIKDGTNWYVYCSNNPIAFVDPTGLRDESLEVLVETCGGTVTYNETYTYIKITVGDKVITYETRLDEYYLKNGEVYVDGADFAAKLGATYTELNTDAYEGFELYYECDDYYSEGTSIVIKENVSGQQYATKRNDQQNHEADMIILGIDMALTLLSRGGSKVVQGAIVGNDIISGISVLVDCDFSDQLRIGERVTTTYVTNCSSSTYQAYSFEKTTIRDENGKIRTNRKQLYQ